MRPVFPRFTRRNVLGLIAGALFVFLSLEFLMPVELGLLARTLALVLGVVLAFGFWLFYRKAARPERPLTDH